ncbi:MAG: lysostaphin resistance A-like protein [Candidatus Thorarchaeota archaeon]
MLRIYLIKPIGFSNKNVAQANPYLRSDADSVGAHYLAISDPDAFEMQEFAGIDIFEPGSVIEREVDWNRLFHILLLTGAAFGISMGLTVILMIPLMANGLIVVDLVTGNIWLDPLAIIVTTSASIGFIIPPIWYVRRNGYALSSLGIKNMKSIKEVLLGIAAAGAMLLANFLVSLLTFFAFGLPDIDVGFFVVSDLFELALWVILMFAVVGFSEELLFRGFLQRRMEMYFRQRRSSPGLYALIITSFIFAIIHLDLFGLPTRFVLGIILGYLSQRRNYSIMAPTIAHGFYNSAAVALVFLGF